MGPRPDAALPLVLAVQCRWGLSDMVQRSGSAWGAIMCC